MSDPNDLHRQELLSLGYSEDEADEVLEAIRDYSPDSVKRLDLKRTDRMFDGLVSRGAFGGNVQAVGVGIKLLERRAKYLGLDVPLRHEHTGKDGDPIEIDVSNLDDEELDRIVRCGTGAVVAASSGGTRAPAKSSNGSARNVHPVANSEVGEPEASSSNPRRIRTN